MKTLILATLLFAATVNAQVISLVPTSYVLTVRVENNFRHWRDNWQGSSENKFTITNRTLIRSHVVSFRGVPSYGTSGGGPNRLEDRYSYRQVGAATYWPIGGEEITFFTQRKDGSWIASTNLVIEADMGGPIFFLPAFVGTLTTGDRLTRTVTTGSPLVMSGRNLLGQAYLLQIPCAGDGVTFDYFERFEAGQRKLVTLGTDNGSGARWFAVDLENTGGRGL